MALKEVPSAERQIPITHLKPGQLARDAKDGDLYYGCEKDGGPCVVSLSNPIDVWDLNETTDTRLVTVLPIGTHLTLEVTK